MKRTLVAIMILTLVAGAGGLCYADPFIDIEDFSGDGTDGGRTYLELDGNGTYYEYSHIVDFTPPAQSISSATLTLSHKNNSANPGEAWFISETNDPVFLGTLANSTSSNAWVDQLFDLSSVLGDISGATWTVKLKLYESTPGNDTLWIDKSVVSGIYEPVATPPIHCVPIPPSMFILGAGIVGLLGLRRNFRYV